MPILSEEEYLKTRLDDQIDWYGNKASKHQKKYIFCRIIELTLAASIPVLLLIEANWIKIIAGTAGAIVATSSGIQSVYKFHENWIEYRATSETLKHEKFLYLTRSGVYKDNENILQLLTERVESIISHENINWSQIHRHDELHDQKPT